MRSASDAAAAPTTAHHVLPSATVEALAPILGASPFFCFDYDGTLAPIVDQPERAFVSEETRSALGALAALHPVAIVSGRSNAKLMDFLELNNVLFAGSHGVDIAGPSNEAIEGPSPTDMVGAEALSALDVARAALDAALGDLDGYLTENNVYCISAHYRMVDEKEHARVRETVLKVLQQHPCLLHREGKMVHELRPAGAWDKGKAVEFLLTKLQARHHSASTSASPLVPFYMGDDVADEEAFRVVARAGGVGIKVADGPITSDATAATYCITQPQVVALLKELFSSVARATP